MNRLAAKCVWLLNKKVPKDEIHDTVFVPALICFYYILFPLFILKIILISLFFLLCQMASFARRNRSLLLVVATGLLLAEVL